MKVEEFCVWSIDASLDPKQIGVDYFYSNKLLESDFSGLTKRKLIVKMNNIMAD